MCYVFDALRFLGDLKIVTLFDAAYLEEHFLGGNRAQFKLCSNATS